MTDEAVVRRLVEADSPMIAAAFRALGWPGKTVEQFERYARQDADGARPSFVAESGGEFAGYCTLLWESDYPAFREQGIPEVSDLNVLPRFRRRGIGTLLLDVVEATAARRSDRVGLGVGLYADYGPAQRMYVRRGYLPDGRGLMHDYAPVPVGAQVANDDDLTLMLVLQFRAARSVGVQVAGSV